MRFRPIWLLSLLILLGQRSEHPLSLAAEDDAAERWLSQQRGEAPAGARKAALEAVANWRKLHSDAATSYVWMPLGPAPLLTRDTPPIANTGRVTAIAISPADPNIVIAGSSSGGIWRSVDGGSTFAPVTDEQFDLPLGAIAFAPSNPNIVYAGMGEDHLGTGVLKSTDAGATWRQVTTSSFSSHSVTKKILVDPTNENIVWLLQGKTLNADGSTTALGPLLKSIDGGATWTSVFTGIVWDLAFPSGDGSTLLIGTVRAATFGTGGIYRTTDGGSTWTQVYAGPANQDSPPNYYLAVGSSGTVFCAALEWVNDTNTFHLLVSADGGVHWTQRADLPNEVRIQYFAVSPHDDQLMFLGAVAGYRSTDGGTAWSRLPTHVDQRAIAFEPVNPSRVWLGNDGGLFRSDDRGATLDSLAPKLPVVQFYSVTAHPTDPAVLFGGSQDNGLQRQNAGAQQWNQMFGGDDFTQVFDRSNPARMLTNSFGAIVVRCENNCDQVSAVATAATFGEPDVNPRYAFLNPFAEGPDGAVWFGTWRIFVSRDFGTTWSAPAGMTDLTAGGKDVLTAIGVAESDASVLYAGSGSGHLMVSRDAALTWTDITPPVGRAITSIAVSRTSPGTALVSFSGYNAGRVCKTTTFGATWTDVSTGLPNMPIDALYIDKSNPETIYAGTDIGAFRSDNSGNSWYPFGNGMPPVIVNSFTTTADGRLIAGTYGRGAYALQSQELSGRRRLVR